MFSVFEAIILNHLSLCVQVMIFLWILSEYSLLSLAFQMSQFYNDTSCYRIFKIPLCWMPVNLFSLIAPQHVEILLCCS